MFTFSFSSAFAAVDWTGEATSKYLTEQGDYEINTAVTGETSEADRGTEGITEAYRAELTKNAKAQLKTIKKNDDVANVVTGVDAHKFDAPEKAKAVSLYETYIESLKTVKTAKDAVELKKDLEDAVKALDDKYTTTYDGAFAAATGVKLNLDRINKRYEDAPVKYYLPGYGVIAYNVTDDVKDIAEAKAWLRDNDYRASKDEIEAGAKALVSALVPMTKTYTDGVKDEQGKILDEIYKYVDKAYESRKGLQISELEGVDALVKKIKAFNEKYEGLKLGDSAEEVKIDVEDFVNAIKGGEIGAAPNTKTVIGLAANYFDQYYSEVSAVPEVKKLTDADKATVIALYKKVNALFDNYADVWDYANITELPTNNNNALAYDYGKLKDAYDYFLEKDVKAFGDLEKFTEMKKVGTAPNQKAYFDASEKNVNALKAQRAAYDALASNYGYADLAGATPGLSYDNAAKAEALILAAEHNMGADAEYDVKDTTKLQNYLNNATLKVTTNALGNNKIRVQARFDADTYKDIVAECGNDYTISYQFYHKTAAASTYKAAKVKDRNYITYTSKSLKKGVKYKFQCGVVIKDAQGNVVAEKSYKASTIGSRVCR